MKGINNNAPFSLTQKMPIVSTKASTSCPVLHTWAPEGKHRNAVHTSEAHLQPPSPFFRTAGWAKIVIVGSKSLERGTHFCKDLWASTSFKMFWIITWVHSPFSFRLDIANDDKCHIHITLQQVSVPHAVFQRLLQALVSLVHSVTPRLFRFIHKFPTY